MKLGDGMMIKNVRIPVVVAICVLLGSGLPVCAADTVTVIRGLAAEAGSSGAVLHLHATGELDTVHYSPQPGVWIVEMPEASWSQEAALLSAPDLGIERVELSDVEEFGKRVTRLTVWLNEPAQLELVAVADGLDLQFASLTGRIVEETVEVEEVPVTSPAQPPPADDLVRSLPTVTQAEQPAVPAVRATNLLAVVPVRSGEGVMVELRGDGELRGQTFTLENPDRLVVDLHGVINREKRQLFAVNSDHVQQVRVAQFRAGENPVTRVVVDLKTPTSYEFSQSEAGAMLTVGNAMAVTPAASETAFMATNETPTVQMDTSNSATDIAASAGAVASNLFDVPEPEAGSSHAIVENAPKPEMARSPFVADASQLLERAPAAQVLDAETLTEEDFETTEVATQEIQFTGEPITLTLKDADIKDVLRTFSALTQLNIVLDPGVSGSVTVELRDVPWDQALDLILRINGLDYVLENNVLRVAPIARLAQEKAAQAAFEQEKERAKPLKTVVKPLSYAKADYVATLLTNESYLLSERGSVVVDERTNKLIIRDVVDRVEGILRLIETLDQPTPQVVIEGRIVETTRDFSRELGVTWGFQSVMNAEHGNDTGLEFPNSVEVAGAVNLPRGDMGFLSFAFADILNTFNLDFVLSAAEVDGIVKIVSTPRVTTQNLQKASIRSGLQIPVQTVANNTVTVQYVDATLRLEVTPQITAEGTVNLEIDIKKQEPVLAAGVVGGQNVPIFTRDAETQLLVRDGGTTVIAGIYQINDQDNENRVPGLSQIPVLGNLFKSKGIFKRHDELLIFITPRIVKY
jgi:type IV pilus assembly protein PilQ